MTKIIKQGETLGQFVKRVREEKDLSTRDVEKKAKGEISDGYINQIETGVALNPSVKKLKALAKGLGINPEKFNQLIYGVSTNSKLTDDEQVLLYEYRRLDGRGQADIIKILQALCNNNE